MKVVDVDTVSPQLPTETPPRVRATEDVARREVESPAQDGKPERLEHAQN